MSVEHRFRNQAERWTTRPGGIYLYRKTVTWDVRQYLEDLINRQWMTKFFDGYIMDPNTTAVHALDEKRPSTVGELRKPLGFFGCYRFIKDSSAVSVPIESFGWDKPRLPWEVDWNSAGCTCSPTAPLPDNHGSSDQLIEELLDVLIKPQTCAWSACLERLLESSNRKLLNTS